MYSSVRNLGQQAASGVRAIHVHAPHAHLPLGVGRPPPAPPHIPKSKPTTGARILQSTRSLFTRVVANLSAPGFTHPVALGRVANLSTRVNATVRPSTIESRLSIPARTALRGMPRAPFLPHATPISKSVTQVGLGTARNFSSARPIFQHLVQNVPVAARAICEADIDVEKRMMKARKGAALKKTSKEVKASKSLLKPSSRKMKTTAAELEKYFPEVALSGATSGTTTILLVPLAPTPTSRYPLSDASSLSEPRLMHRRELREILTSHRKHQLRVSSLFARLDSNSVWGQGASFSAHGDADGLCTLLRIEFVGWTKDRVTKVLGDAGRGWCEIIEVKDDASEENSTSAGYDSDLSPAFSSRSLSPDAYDPSASVVLPTLDFSASFMATRAHECASPPLSLPPSPPASLPGSGYSSPMLGLSSLNPSEFGDVEDHQSMDLDMDGMSNFSFTESPEWSDVESPRMGASAMSLSASFIERSGLDGWREVRH